MKKFIVQVGALLVVIFGALYISFQGNNPLTQTSSSTSRSNLRQLLIKNKVINIEVADTSQKRAQGLSGRDHLNPDSGMLFIFDKPGKYQFWMKDMKIPLDMIFINQGQVVDFIRNVPPPAPNTPTTDLKIYQSVEDFNMQLEVPAGFIDQNHIDIGDKVSQVATP